jgi:hypothetical protein
MLWLIAAWTVKEGVGLLLGAVAKLALDAWNSYQAGRRASHRPPTRSTWKRWRPKMRWKLFLVLPSTALLTACDLGSSDVVVKIVCPTIMQYDAKTQERSLAEYQALPAGSALKQFIGDYTGLRDQVTVCRARSAK